MRSGLTSTRVSDAARRATPHEAKWVTVGIIQLPAESVIKLKEDTSKDQRAVLEVEFDEALPKWVKAPWMYIKPNKGDQIESWLESWSAIVLDYSRIFVIHIININEIRSVHPFQNKKIGKRLTIDQVRDIIDHLVTQNIAKWIDEDNKTRARIYWKSDEEWADQLLDFMIETGRVK